MTEPTATLVGVCLSWFSSACIAAVLGIDQQAILWAFFGACIGLSIAPGASFLKALLVFVFVTLACALGGTVASHAWHRDDPLWRNGYACVLAICFHPIVATGVNQIPLLVKAWAQRFGARQ